MKVRSCKTNDEGEVCKNILETGTFTYSNDQIAYRRISRKFDCNEKCLLYLVTCN